MKKYLITGALALAAGISLTSCHSDDEIYGSIVEQKLKAYEEVFTEEFGRIDPNQDWGFGNDSFASTDVNATRTISRSWSFNYYSFPGDAAASKFLSKVPDGVEKLTQNVAEANHWIDETWQGDLNIWGEATGGSLYIKGNCDFSNRSFYFCGNSELYLLEGATLTLGANNGAGNLQQNTMIYVAKGAKIIAKGELILNNGLHIYNHGTIEAPKLSTNNNSVLYNVGIVKVDNKISVENTLSVIVNDGTITATDLNTAGSGKFENNGSVTISGTTFVNSNDNTWVNNGQYHTGNFLYNAASDEVINNCRLTVDNEFNINLGDNPGDGNFKMNSGSGVVTRYFNGGGNWNGTYAGTDSKFNGGPFYILMGGGSVFKVTDTATMNATKADYGVYGPESGSYAVFQAENIVAGKAGQGYEVTYGGKLAVVAGSHFANGMSGSYPYIDIKDGAIIYAPGFDNGSLPEFSISGTECNPGFTGGGSDDTLPVDPIVTSYKKKVTTVTRGKTVTLLKSGRVMCEDLGNVSSNDLDFNDIVFDAYVYKIEYWNETFTTIDGKQSGSSSRRNTSTEYKTDIVLLAGGGTLPVTLAGQNMKNVWETEETKVPDDMIINTIEEGDPTYGNINGEFDPQYLGRFDYSSIAAIPIYVHYPNGETQELKALEGAVTHKICVPITTRWTKERQKMKDAYEVFPEYVSESVSFWDNPSKINGSLLYKELSYTIPDPLVEGEEILSTEISEENVEDSTSGGIQNGDEVLSRRKNLK